MLDLSIIILSFNTRKLTLECINSLVKNSENIKYEIIVVDNASSDGSLKEIKKLAKKYPIVLVKNKENLGFAKANNIGIKNSKGRYILLLNSDTLIKDNVLGEMVFWMDRHKKVGVSGCSLRNRDGSVQASGGYFPSLINFFSWMFFIDDIPFLEKIIKPFHLSHSLLPLCKDKRHFFRQRDWLTGAFFLIRKEVIESVGLLDEDYFMYTEDVDYCYRVKKMGWKIIYLPRWSIIHLGGGSATNEFSLVSEFQGIKTFFQKNKPEWQLPIIRLFLKGGALARFFLWSVLQRKGLVKIYAKAFKIA